MESKYPIRVVAAKTGLSSHLIRMWERRYGAVEPSRTDTRRRLYSDTDVQRLSLLRRATQAGANIGQIANLPDAELRELVSSYEQISVAGKPRGASPPDAGYFLDMALEAVGILDAARLESVLLQASVALGRTVLLEEVIMKFLEQVGDDWISGRLKVAHEHLASSVSRSFLGRLIEANTIDAGAPVFIATTPAGQLHEFGALISAVTASDAGWQVIYLGPNLPAEDIAGAVRQTDARVVALSLVYPPDDNRLRDELRTIRRLIDPDVQIIVGGRTKEGYQQVLSEIGAVQIDALNNLADFLGVIRTQPTNGGGR